MAVDQVLGQPERIGALRFHAGLYLHGHTVGGTNPSLVEAMAAGNAVIAHDNHYNTWVAGPGNAFFTGTDDLALLLDELLGDAERRRRMGTSSRARFRAEFTWTKIGSEYEYALRSALARRAGGRRRRGAASVPETEIKMKTKTPELVRVPLSPTVAETEQTKDVA